MTARGGTALRTEKPSYREELDLMDTGTDSALEHQASLSAHEICLFVDELEDLLCSGFTVPLSSKTLVDREECLDTLEVLRANLPWEMLEAKRILSEQGSVLEQAEAEAEEMRHLAERQAARIVDQSQLVKMAEARAAELIEAAERKAAQIVGLAEQDARDLYRSMESELDLLVRDIKGLVAARLKNLGE